MRVWLGGVLLAAAVAGCGGGEDPLASATVRPIGAAFERAAAEERENALQAREPEAGSAQAPAQATAAGNRPPRLKRVQVHPAERIVGGQDIWVAAVADDPEGDPIELRYTWWVNGEELEQTGPVLSSLSLQRGDSVRVSVVATDGSSESEPLEGPLLTVVNGAPVIRSTPSGAGPDGVFRYQVRAEDPEGDTDLRFSLERAPQGMRVTALGGLVQWRPTAAQAGVHPVQIAVEDSEGGRATQSFELTISPPPAAPMP